MNKPKWQNHLASYEKLFRKNSGDQLSNGLFVCIACHGSGRINFDFDDWDSKPCELCKETGQMPKRLLNKARKNTGD